MGFFQWSGKKIFVWFFPFSKKNGSASAWELQETTARVALFCLFQLLILDRRATQRGGLDKFCW